MPVSESQIKSWLTQVDQCRKKIIDIQTRAQRDISSEEKKIIDLENKIRKG
jgi:hypothetical protein